MKVSHRGYEIEVTREDCLGGWSQLYYTVYRKSDGLECVCDHEDSAETVRDKVQQMKDLIDLELTQADPWGEEFDPIFART